MLVRARTFIPQELLGALASASRPTFSRALLDCAMWRAASLSGAMCGGQDVIVPTYVSLHGGKAAGESALQTDLWMWSLWQCLETVETQLSLCDDRTSFEIKLAFANPQNECKDALVWFPRASRPRTITGFWIRSEDVERWTTPQRAVVCEAQKRVYPFYRHGVDCTSRPAKIEKSF